ncbi:uncharacterized protein N7518_006149 [Penicillium psychrosexuale]|uniref:uncharacterized protein n=1 Tax=Penicillium psychrosexuale TaxID=1002107 RepID=UPI00254567FF|nr:uncharacterized protein N7518_006149 [Penicillium psychrosexuale]KAJ5789138.1 hypothetical protein N7518_006149 [Penicillium psychrosexuale]
MRIAVFSAQPYDKASLDQSNRAFKHEITYHEAGLSEKTALLASGFPAICVFVNDQINANVIHKLAEHGTRLIALRCAGFNNVDLVAAKKAGITVVRVPAYSPNAVAEYTLGLVLCLERKIHKAWLRVREDNFALNGLLGTDLYGRTIGVVGAGRIGSLVARSFRAGLGCEVLACDIVQNPELVSIGVKYVSKEELLRQADVICLHCPLTPDTRHLINSDTLRITRPGVTIVNTGRGALIDFVALLDGLESGHVGGAALDVYEYEKPLFFRDLSEQIVSDHTFRRLITLPNVIVTGHQAFFSRQALESIANTTLSSVGQFEKNGQVETSVTLS